MNAFRKRQVKRLRVHCPMAPESWRRLMAGDHTALADDPAIGAILAIARDDTPFGDFGLYRGVVELSPGWEIFTPGAHARPALGAAAQETVSPTLILTFHVPADADPAAIDATVDRILAAQPWEIPVIEWDETWLVQR
ncbi:hypothetical protein ACX40Y_02855 [Sphingomonas sp. RS6]